MFYLTSFSRGDGGVLKTLPLTVNRLGIELLRRDNVRLVFVAVRGHVAIVRSDCHFADILL
jgi:hypothetical protein